MATFTALVKIYPNISAIQRYMYLGLVKFLSSKIFLAIQYVLSVSPLTHPHNYTHLPN